MFFPYRHRSPWWHWSAVAGFAVMAAVFAATALLFAGAAVDDRDGPLAMGAAGAFFGLMAAGFAFFGWRGAKGVRRYAAAWAERAPGEDQTRYGITFDVFKVRSLRFDPLGDQGQELPRQLVTGARLRPYDKRTWLHVETSDGGSYWFPTYLMSPADRGEVLRLFGVR